MYWAGGMEQSHLLVLISHSRKSIENFTIYYHSTLFRDMMQINYPEKQ